MHGIARCSMSFWASRSNTRGSLPKRPPATRICSAGAEPMPAHEASLLRIAGSSKTRRLPETVVAISLGSNLGDRREHLEYAIDRLRNILDALQASSFI